MLGAAPHDRSNRLFRSQFQLARRSVRAVRPDRVVRPGAHRADRGERLGQVHPAQAHRGGVAPRFGCGTHPRRGGLPAAGHHPRHPPERFRPAWHHRRQGRAARHRGGRDGRGRLRGDRGRLGRRGARPRLAGPPGPGPGRSRRPGGAPVRRGDHRCRAGRAVPAPPGHPAAGRADQQPGPGRAPAAVRRGGVLDRGDGDRQPRPRAARPDGPDRRPVRRRDPHVRRQPGRVRRAARGGAGGGRARASPRPPRTSGASSAT